jgi:hypothetical protein
VTESKLETLAADSSLGKMSTSELAELLHIRASVQQQQQQQQQAVQSEQFGGFASFLK